MLFNSFAFLLFFPTVTLVYFLLPHRFRNSFLLIASSFFYASFIPSYLLILFALIVADFFIAKKIHEKKGRRKKQLLIVGIVISLLPLLFFKYTNFLFVNLLAGSQLIGGHFTLPILNLALPIGLSFHTFQSISYLADIYKGKQKPEKQLRIYALFILFYPQLVAGPIERPEHMLPQFRKKHHFSYVRCKEGVLLMARGYFKKMVVADNLALVVNHIFLTPHLYIGFPLFLAVVAFSIQIYADFAGYTDIARGAARVMGFQLVENFRFPYFATSLSQFWQRWHISLSSWLRDYIYIPLGGNRVHPFLRVRNVLITFVVSGLWHGAAWTYVIWGIVHGGFITIETIFYTYLGRFQTSLLSLLLARLRWAVTMVRILVTFSLVCVAWTFFRAATISDALYILGNMPKGFLGVIAALFRMNWSGVIPYLFKQNDGMGVDNIGGLIIICSTLFLLLLELGEYRNVRVLHTGKARFLLFVIFVLAVINLGVTNEIPFIYFQF